jgi:hypothetical protein
MRHVTEVLLAYQNSCFDILNKCYNQSIPTVLKLLIKQYDNKKQIFHFTIKKNTIIIIPCNHTYLTMKYIHLYTSKCAIIHKQHMLRTLIDYLSEVENEINIGDKNIHIPKDIIKYRILPYLTLSFKDTFHYLYDIFTSNEVQ